MLSHKTLLAVLAFVVIAVLLLLHYRSGLRGRRAARIVLVAYLLLPLAYPRVKFVTDVLLASGAAPRPTRRCLPPFPVFPAIAGNRPPPAGHRQSKRPKPVPQTPPPMGL